MANKRERLKTLKQWAEYFPWLHIWDDQTLIKRNGTIISGICLDRTSEKNKYEAVYFMSIAINESWTYSLNYSQRLIRHNGAVKTLYYDKFNPDDTAEFKKQIPLVEQDISFDDFFTFVEGLYDYRKTGNSLPNIAHALQDVSTVGAYCGDKEYCLEQLPLCKKILDKFEKDDPSLNPVDTDKWFKETQDLLNSDLHQIVQQNLSEQGVGELQDNGLKYNRIENYPQRLKKALYNFYPNLRGFIGTVKVGLDWLSSR